MRLDFDLIALRAFVTVARTGHVGKAAEILNMTQSPLSRRIKDLEFRLGFDLFERRGKRLILLPTGRDILPEAEALLDRAGALSERTTAMARGAGGVLRVGYVPAALHSGVLGQAAAEMARRNCDLHLSPMRSDAQFEALSAGRLDVGLTYRAPEVGELTHRRIHREPFVLALPEGWEPVAAALDGRPFAAPLGTDQADAGAELTRACHAAGFAPDLRYRVEDPLCALQLVAAGLCGAIVQAGLAGLCPKSVTVHDLPAAFPMDVSLFSVSIPSRAPQVVAFLEFLLKSEF